MKSKDICIKRSFCTGCEACANICPQDAIIMTPDWRGFKYPHIDQKKCVDCGLCQKTCPINTSIEPFVFGNAAVFVDKNKNYLTQASSGGAFGVIARYILSEGGIVFGASMDDNYNVNFIGVERLEDLHLLHGSKYVQAYVGNIYREVKKHLKGNRKVLFCGCPCQVAGLNNYLKKEYDNLVTMDLICHGVPSQPYFKDYVNDLLKQKSSNGIKSFRFRYKPINEEEKRSIHIGYYNPDYYMTYFLWGKGYRSGCYNCKFAGGKRSGDFTIGDFWNNKNAKLPIDVSNGSSLVLLNTSKAQILSEKFQANGVFIPVNTLNDAIGGTGGQLKHPSKYDIRCDLIYILYKFFGLKGPKLLYKIELLRMRKRK